MDFLILLHFFQDTWADQKGLLHLDNVQNCNNFKHKNVGSTSKFTFTRKFDTCDDQDYIIEVIYGMKYIFIFDQFQDCFMS